jgi:hypothetical protein
MAFFNFAIAAFSFFVHFVADRAIDLDVNFKLMSSSSNETFLAKRGMASYVKIFYVQIPFLSMIQRVSVISTFATEIISFGRFYTDLIRFFTTAFTRSTRRVGKEYRRSMFNAWQRRLTSNVHSNQQIKSAATDNGD